MKRKQLLMMLLLALVVPLAALAQVERTVTVYNGTDKECHVPLYGYITRMEDLSLSQFIMDKSVLQAAGLAGKEITKMTFHLATPVPASYEWTTKRRTIVMLAEVDASEFSNGNFIPNADMTNSKTVAAVYLEAHGETMEISFSSPYTYSGEKNLLVYLGEEYMYYFGYNPFGTYRLPMYYGVYKTGASVWKKNRATDNYSTISSLNCHFVPKTTFTYLTEANWANTKAPKNATTTSGYSIGNNINSFNYYIRMDWDASDNYTGSYQVLCVPRGTSSLDWTNATTTSETFYVFEGLQKNTPYDLYVRAKQGYVYTSNAATASATTPFYPANLDEGPLTFNFESRTMPNGLEFDCSAPHYLRAYGALNYCEEGTNFVGATVYGLTPALTITLPELKFTNATNGLMVEFDLQGEGVEVHNFYTAEMQVKIYDYNNNQEVFSQTVSASYPSQHFTFRLPDLTTSNYHIYKLSFSYEGGHGFSLDNIVVRKAPNIMPPYNLAASEITSTSAKISWTDDNTNSHTFDLVYRQKGYSNDPNVWEHYVQGVTNPYYTLTGLTPYTDYEVKVKTITSSAYEDSEIMEFSTLCTPAEVPYNEPFTGLTTLPTDWRINEMTYAEVVTEVGNGRLTLHNTSAVVEEDIYGYLYTHTVYSQFGAYIILPYFNNLGSLQFSFKAGRTQGALESLQVSVMAYQNNNAIFTPIGTATLTDNANGEVYSYNLVNDAIQNGHIVIHFSNSDSKDQSIWLDDFSVQQYAAPTDLNVSNVTNTSATLGWNAGAATEWEVRYGTDANSYGTPVAVTEPACTITGLTANTEYTAQVRAKYGDDLYSEWVSFDSFKTYYSTPVVVDQTHPYSFGFQYLSMVGTVLASEGGWQMINMGLHANNWMIGTKPGTIDGFSGTNYSLFISNNGSDYQYIHGEQNVIGTWTSWATTVYAARVFNLAPGSYQFSYDWRAKGIHDSDYFRVVLVPANTELTAGTSVPSGFSYNSLPEGWIALDGGEALNPISFNYGFDTYTTPESARINILEGGDYMMVFVWNNMGSRVTSVQNPPIAFDNVAINCTSLVYPPAVVAALHDQVTDTEAPLALYASEQGITPTSYEVQYEPAAAVNTYEGAPIATFNVTENPQTVTLTGLTPLTLYSARVRSVYTANGKSVYSDWQNCPSLFTTLCTPPTNLVVVGQTSSWANVRWNPVEMTLPNEQYINYCVQLTTDLNDWGEEDCGWSSDSWEKNLAPGTYHFRVRTAVYQEEGNLYMGGSDWSEPITFTIAPWTDPVTIFPLTYGFEEWSNHFADGLTLDGDYENLDILTYCVSDVPTPEEGDNEYALQFRSTANKTACLVLPPLRPSTSSALVSFWWYHNNSDNNAGEGVIVEYSSDGSSWTSFGDVIPRYAAQTGWVKYQKVVPTLGTNASYIRLRFEGASSSKQGPRYCYLDDLKVYAFKSEQPYISYVGCNGNSATITLYDYAVENGYHSSQFEVQYREWRDPSETQEDWVTYYPAFVNQEPYTFENELVVNGLQPTTLYEFRAHARVSFGGYDFDWSGYCEPYRQWTDCGTYIITPTQSYTMDFEDEFYYNCWSGDIDETAWHVTTDDAHSGTKSFYIDHSVTGTTNLKELLTPQIDLTQLYASTDNVVLRFWVKYTSTSNHATMVPTSSVNVYNGSSTVYQLCQIPLNTDGWTQIELSLSKQMGNVVTVGFKTASRSHVIWYIDDIEIVANPYPGVKICDIGGYNYASQWNYADSWYPNGVPTASDDVMILEGSPSIPDASYNRQVKSIVIGHGGDLYSPTVASSLNVIEGVETHSYRVNPKGVPSNTLSIGATTTFTAQSVTIASECPMQVAGTANITTLNPGSANSVVVKDGGVLNATTITGTNGGANDKMVIKSGGQVKTENAFYGTIEKDITGYGAENVDGKAGWYLVATPTQVTVEHTFVPQSGSDYLFDQMDFYWFDGGADLEWINAKCALEGGCPGPNGSTIPQGQISVVLGQPKKGYLYARQNDGTVQMVAGPVGNIPFPATNVDSDVNLDFYSNNDALFNGWNLIGNPFTCDAYVKRGNSYLSFYKMNETGDLIVLADAGTPIKPCEGVFVQCNENANTRTATFTSTEPSRNNSMTFSLHKPNETKGGVSTGSTAAAVDRARIQFGEGHNLGHLDLMADPNRLYIPMTDKAMAVVNCQPVGEMPLNFEAAANGTYTLSFENETEGLTYCHLIDNLTGADVDLLQQPEYTFDAKVSDYASRFKVVFVSSSQNADGDNETFAFNSNGNWVIANEGRATLQVIDLNGRILSSEQIEGCAETHINAAAGIYVIRLINGENVRTQKVIVK